MSRALVMAVYYSSGAFTPSWPAPLPIRILVGARWINTVSMSGRFRLCII